MSTASPWTGELLLGDYAAVYLGPIGDAAPHRHLAAQAVFGGATLSTAHGERQGELLLIDPLLPHRLWPSAQAHTLVFIEPSHRQVAPRWRSRVRALAEGCEVAVLAAPERSFWSADTASIDAAWRTAAAQELEALLGAALTLAAAAARMHLSPSRFRHRFAETMGVPFRRYVLWRRLRQAAHCIGAGASATEAAHAAGFADAAHFSRTLRGNFGVSPQPSLLRMQVRPMPENYVDERLVEALRRNGSRSCAR